MGCIIHHCCCCHGDVSSSFFHINMAGKIECNKRSHMHKTVVPVMTRALSHHKCLMAMTLLVGDGDAEVSCLEFDVAHFFIHRHHISIVLDF